MGADGLGPGLDSYVRAQGRRAAERFKRGEGATRCPYDANAGLTSARLARAWTEAHRETLQPPDPKPLPT
jgi:hypothetical protein